MKKKLLAMLLGMAMAVTLITGCGNQNEETPVHDGHPANGFLWAVLGTVIVLVLYFVTNLF